ncbi:MAG: hypothetical protein JSW55_14090 [Chloroflexota bacterium]|nr:MAG: hypothetical protein JSW55_14090 [Chloroflexota bacterium]
MFATGASEIEGAEVEQAANSRENEPTVHSSLSLIDASYTETAAGDGSELAFVRAESMNVSWGLELRDRRPRIFCRYRA